MSLPKEVAEAMAHMDFPITDESDWQTIRAYLMSQDAEIERLQSELAAANALLREIKEWDVMRAMQPTREETLFAIPLHLRKKIADQLQGAGDEA